MASGRQKRRRKRGRGILGSLFKLLCALAVAGALVFGATVFFQVETVQVEGTSRYTPDQIVEVSGVLPGDNLYRFSKSDVITRILDTLPYVESVKIRRRPPSTLIIKVEEWTAVARVDPASKPYTSIDNTEESLIYVSEPWLISPPGSGGCRMLEPAIGTTSAIPVSGITPVNAEEGGLLKVGSDEQLKLTALENLLGELDRREAFENVTSVQLGDTQLVLNWQDRFEVHFTLTADFSYKLSALEASIPEVERRRGQGATGVLDLTEDGGPIRYSPFDGSPASSLE